MKNLTPFALAALAATGVAYGCARASAQTVSVPSDPARQDVELVVYADNFAVVRETRQVELEKGRVRVGLPGVSKSLDQNSVVFRWPSAKDAKVVSSTYEMGVSDSSRLLSRFLGKEVELVYRGLDGKPGERVRGTLEVAESDNIVVKADGKYIVNPNATIEAPTDAGIVTIPQLSAEVESGTSGSTDLAVTYMTDGLSWSADYTATLAPNSDKLGLECWASVTNQTGTDFPSAKISFVAGSPNRAPRRQPQYDRAYAMAGAVAAPESKAKMDRDFEAQPQAVGELYAYPYKSTATIRQDQMNRVRMMGSDSVKVKKLYRVDLPALYHSYSTFAPSGDSRTAANMSLRFTNSQPSGLGLPLPAGAVRVYEPDATGNMNFVGEARMGDTPKDAKVELSLSKSIDVYAKPREVSSQRIDRRHVRRTVEVTLVNEKKEPVPVQVTQPMDDRWRMASETAKSDRPDSSTAHWQITIPAGGEVKLRYSVVFGP